MKKSELIALLCLTGFLTSACVTSTTTGAVPPEANDGDAAEYNYQLGARYYQAQSYDLALDRLQRAIELDDNMAKAYMTLGMTYEALENKRLATEAYKDAIRAAPRDFNIQNGYAVFLCRQRDYEGAGKYFERAANHPENDDAEQTLTNAGLCMMQKPDDVAAERFFRAALESKASYGEALLQLCLLKYKSQDYLGARAFLQRYMAGSTTTAGVLYLGAEIEGKLGNARGRKEFVDRLLSEYPDSPEAGKVQSDG